MEKTKLATLLMSLIAVLGIGCGGTEFHEGEDPQLMGTSSQALVAESEGAARPLYGECVDRCGLGSGSKGCMRQCLNEKGNPFDPQATAQERAACAAIAEQAITSVRDSFSSCLRECMQSGGGAGCIDECLHKEPMPIEPGFPEK